MQEFTGLEMLKIDIANCFGKDKETWLDRLTWFHLHEAELGHIVEQAAEPMLYIKAVTAYNDTLAGQPSGHNMFLDATASGLQIMAALSGCKKTAKHVNLINTGKREDVYDEVMLGMNGELPLNEMVTRGIVKKPVMTHYYNKTKQDTLSELQQEAFYNVLSESFEGAEAVKDTINNFWDTMALEHTWTLPDGHVARVKVTEMVDARIEVDELEHTTFTYRFEANKPSQIGTSLVPNIIHSIDAYLVREMVRRSNESGFELAHIHDAFCAHPNNMQWVRIFYADILAEIADTPLLENILSEIAGKHIPLEKFSNDLAKDIRKSEYALS